MSTAKRTGRRSSQGASEAVGSSGSKSNFGIAKVLVTGCSGFLAGKIIDMLLARGIAVRGCDIAPTSRTDIEFVKADLRNLEDVKKACQGVDTIMHTAAAFYKAPADLVHAVNVVGTQNVVAAAQSCGVKRIVYTSSGSVVFRGRDMNNVDESEPYAEPTLFFRDAYTLTKAEAERIVLGASGKNGLTSVALRPHQIYGPGDRHFIPAVADNARMNIIQLGRAGRKVTMTYVDNIAHAHVVAALALADPSRAEKVAGQPFNINDGEAVDFLEDVIFRAVQDIAGIPRSRLGKIPIPFFMIYMIAFVAEVLTYPFGLELKLTRTAMSIFCAQRVQSIKRARELLGYEPIVSASEGIRRTMEDARQIYSENRNKAAAPAPKRPFVAYAVGALGALAFLGLYPPLAGKEYLQAATFNGVPVEELSTLTCRVFAVWTWNIGFLRLAYAYAPWSRPLTVATYFSFLGSFALYVSEIFIFKTVVWGTRPMMPLFISGTIVVLMSLYPGKKLP